MAPDGDAPSKELTPRTISAVMLSHLRVAAMLSHLRIAAILPLLMGCEAEPLDEAVTSPTTQSSGTGITNSGDAPSSPPPDSSPTGASASSSSVDGPATSVGGAPVVSPSETGSPDPGTGGAAEPAVSPPDPNASNAPTGGADPGSGGVAATPGKADAGGSAGAVDVAPSTPSDGDPVDARALVADLGFGTNIGNTLENTTEWEVGWGQPLISEAFIEGIRSRGIKTVRVPVAWDTYATAGVIDAAKLERVKQVVRWIEAAGMYAIVNIHWDGGWLFNESGANEFRLTDDVKAKFTAYWEQIATGLGDVGHRLILEGLNEEARYFIEGDSSNPPDYTALNSINQLFVSTVRALGGYNATRALLIVGFQTDIELTCVDDFAVPSDPAGPGKLFLSVHYYTPFTFCGLDTVESWGSPATTWGTAEELATLERLFDQLAAFSNERGLPVILGEFAVTPGQNYVREPESRIRWMEAVTRASFERGIVPVLWDTGSEISRSDGSFSAELQAVKDSLGSAWRE